MITTNLRLRHKNFNKISQGDSEDDGDDILSSENEVSTDKKGPKFTFDLFMEQCSELWNNIKDLVDEEPEEYTSLLPELEARYQRLIQQFDELAKECPNNLENFQLRLLTITTAMDQLKQKQEAGYNKTVPNLRPVSFRRWLQLTKIELDNLKREIFKARGNILWLHKLKSTQQAFQSQIETEGRLKSQQKEVLDKSKSGNTQRNDHRFFCDIWLQSLENLEIIEQFIQQAEQNSVESHEVTDSEEDGEPVQKRRKTSFSLSAFAEDLKIVSPQKRITNSHSLKPSTEMQTISLNISTDQKVPDCVLSQENGPESVTERIGSIKRGSITLDKLSTTSSKQLDVGYSSGGSGSPKHSVISESSVNESKRPSEAKSKLQFKDQTRSYYKTVPLDEWGMTDIDIDDGAPSTPYTFLSYDLLTTGENTAPALTDSMIVNVEAPPTNDYDEVMGIMDAQKQTSLNLDHSKHFLQLGQISCEVTTDDDEATERASISTPFNKQRKRPLNKFNTSTPFSIERSKNVLDTWQNAVSREKKKIRRNVQKLKQFEDFSLSYGKENRHNCEDESDSHSTTDVESSDIYYEDSLMETSQNSNSYISVQESPYPSNCTANKGSNSNLEQFLSDGNFHENLVLLRKLVEKSLTGIDQFSNTTLAELRWTFRALFDCLLTLEAKVDGLGNGSGKEKKQDSKMTFQSELVECHERMNNLETMCNHLAEFTLKLSNHLAMSTLNATNRESSELEQSSTESNSRDEFVRFRNELVQLIERFTSKVDTFRQSQSNLNKSKPPSSPLQARLDQRRRKPYKQLRGSQKVESKVKSPKGHKKSMDLHVPNQKGPPQISLVEQTSLSTRSNVTTSEVQTIQITTSETSTQEEVSAEERPKRYSRRKQILTVCSIAFAMALIAFLLNGTNDDWRWQFGPQLVYVAGPPPH